MLVDQGRTAPMKTYNLVIYHCLNCGAVIDCAFDRAVPHCCGRPMVRTGAKTVASYISHDPEGVPASAHVRSLKKKPR